MPNKQSERDAAVAGGKRGAGCDEMVPPAGAVQRWTPMAPSDSWSVVWTY